MESLTGNFQSHLEIKVKHAVPGVFPFIHHSVCNVTPYVSVPEFFIEVEGVVHAELWQRPAEICLMFLPWRAATSVGSFTELVCPRPSWNTRIKTQHGKMLKSAMLAQPVIFRARRLPVHCCCSPRHRRLQWRTWRAHGQSPQQCLLETVLPGTAPPGGRICSLAWSPAGQSHALKKVMQFFFVSFSFLGSRKFKFFLMYAQSFR